MAQHTKDPWHIGSEQDYQVDRYAKNAEWARVRGSDGGLIATVESVHPAGKRQSQDFDIEAARARLIAAAPDLLAELDRSLAWIAKVAADHDGDGTGLSEKAMRQFDRNIAAIAKATA